jgi:hypothetical protein
VQRAPYRPYQADPHQEDQQYPPQPRRRRRRFDTRAPRARQGWIVALTALCALVIGAVAFVGHRGHVALSSAPNATLLGSSAASVPELSQLTSDYGHMPVDRVYYPGLPADNAWSSSGKAGANNSEVVVSFKALPKDILSGADDASLSHFFDTAPTNHPVYYSYYHEPEDNIAAGQFNMADYRAAWAHVVALANAAHNPQLHATLILMAYDLASSSGRNWKDYLPGGGIIAALGWDAYPAGAVANSNPQLTSPATFMGPCVAASKSVGLPFGFAEFGVEALPGRAAWLQAVGDYIMKSGALWGTYFQAAQLTDGASVSAWRGQVVTSVTDSQPSPGTPGPTIYTPTPTPTFSQPPKPTSKPTASASPTPPAGTPTPSSSPTPAPSSSAPAPPPPAPVGPGISALSANPAILVPVGQNHVMIRFTLAHSADVKVDIVAPGGKVAREIIRPNRHAGRVAVSYYGWDGHSHRLSAGRYQIVVTATSSAGSSTAQLPLIIGS